jgi:hypothetical protein
MCRFNETILAIVSWTIGPIGTAVCEFVKRWEVLSYIKQYESKRVEISKNKQYIKIGTCDTNPTETAFRIPSKSDVVPVPGACASTHKHTHNWKHVRKPRQNKIICGWIIRTYGSLGLCCMLGFWGDEMALGQFFLRVFPCKYRSAIIILNNLSYRQRQ